MLCFDRRLGLSVLINVLLFLLFFLLFVPRFAINDDPAMMRISSGALLDKPSEYLVYINVIIGLFLAHLYTIFPQMNWYVILFYSIHFISMVVVLFVLLQQSFSLVNVILYLSLFVLFKVNFLTNLQFTTVAFVVGTSGVLMLLSYKKEERKWILILGVLLILLSGLIRNSAAYALFALSIPLFFVKAFYEKSRKLLIPIIVSLILFMGANIYNTHYYQRDPNWEYYINYNKLRAHLTDYPFYGYSDFTKHIYKEIGWTENKVLMFRNWSFADKQVFSFEDLDFIVSSISIENPLNDIFKLFYKAIMFLKPSRLLYIFIIFIISLCTINSKNRQYLLVSFMMVVFVMIYLSYYGRVLPRVVIPIFYYFCCITLFFLSDLHGSIFLRLKVNMEGKVILGLSISVILLFVFIIDAKETHIHVSVQDKIDYHIEKISDHNYIYANWPFPSSFYTLIVSQHFIPSFYTQRGNDNLHIIPFGGWSLHSPHVDQIYSELAIDNIYIDLVGREDLVLIAHPILTEHLLPTFMKENYNLDIGFIPLNITEGIPIYAIFQINEHHD